MKYAYILQHQLSCLHQEYVLKASELSHRRKPNTTQMKIRIENLLQMFHVPPTVMCRKAWKTGKICKCSCHLLHIIWVSELWMVQGFVSHAINVKKFHFLFEHLKIKKSIKDLDILWHSWYKTLTVAADSRIFLQCYFFSVLHMGKNEK